MIKNKKQLEVTKSRINDFKATLAQLTSSPKDPQESDILQKAQLSAVRSTIQSLEKEAATYESLSEGQICSVKGGSFDELARILIQARMAKGWSQTRLAEEMGIEPQQIQRYEANDYETTSLARLYEVVDALAISLSFDALTVTKDDFEPNETTVAIQQKIIDRQQLFTMVA